MNNMQLPTFHKSLVPS